MSVSCSGAHGFTCSASGPAAACRCAAPSRTRRIAKLPAGSVRRGYPRVLVVEDDEPLREYYRAGLGGRFVVDACADGMSALAYFDRHCPDAVVLDLKLPRLDGRTLYNELRHHPLTAGIPVVVVTGVDPTPEVPGALVLRKPCGIAELIGALERALTPEEPTGRP
jgi:DNA-binding response OmpR family regulator